jgi:hypothetical protein
MGFMSAPGLEGIQHLKVHVTDVGRSARWYARTRGCQPLMEFVERSRLVGYGMSHPNGGTLLTLRLDLEQARKTAGWVYFEMGVPDTIALKLCSDAPFVHQRKIDHHAVPGCPGSRGLHDMDTRNDKVPSDQKRCAADGITC